MSCRNTDSFRRPGGTKARYRIPTRPGQLQRDTESRLETFYALAVDTPGLKREVEAHMRHLGSDCDPGWRPAGAEVDGWLARLDELMERHPANADWQALRVRYQP